MEESVKYAQGQLGVSIPVDLYERFNRLGLIPSDVRSGNIGASNYSEYTIQPWSIWIDYNLNPWDADIVKRVLRTKDEPGMSPAKARILDYQKMIHICKERIRQIELGQDYPKKSCDTSITLDPLPEVANVFSSIAIANPAKRYVKPIQMPKAAISYHLNEEEASRYYKFAESHKECKGCVDITFSHRSGIGVSKTAQCSNCGASEDITDVSTW